MHTEIFYFSRRFADSADLFLLLTTDFRRLTQMLRLYLLLLVYK